MKKLRWEFIILLQDEEPFTGGGEFGDSPITLVFFKFFYWSDILLKCSLSFNNDLEDSHSVSYFSTCNTGVIPICTQSLLSIFSITTEADPAGTYFCLLYIPGA